MTTGSKCVGASFLAMIYASAAAAQVTSTPPASGGVGNLPASGQVSSSPTTASGDIPEIVVTAQRRKESAQVVPIAVTTFNADQISRLRITSADDLTTVIPGLEVSQNGGRDPIFLRGVGNNNYATAPSVLTFIDGVYQPFNSTGGADYSNIQNIEVLKGPQGTLFGRNATGGVIQITTKDPRDWQGADVEIGYGNYNTQDAKVYASAKLTDNIAASVAAFYLNQKSGWGKNVFDGSDIYTAERYGVRSKLVAEIDDTFTATIAVDYSHHRGQVGNGWSPGVGYDFLYDSSDGRKLFLGPYDINSNEKPRNWSEEGGVALTLDKRVGDIKLLSISSYRADNEFFLVDDDGGPNNYFTLDRGDSQQVVTQEFQASASSEGFSWAAGVYYYGAQDSISGPNFIGPFSQIVFGAAPGQALALHQTDRDDAYAGYAQGTLEVLPQTNLTFGTRFTVEERRLEGFTTGSTGQGVVPVPPSPNRGSEGKTFAEPNFRVALDYRFTPSIMVYGSWSRGFNAGFFSQQSLFGDTDAANPALRPEVINAYEVGVKSDLLDRHLRVNLAAFLYNYDDLQQQIYVNGAVDAVNAAGAQIKGVDFEVVTAPVQDLILSIAGTYLDPTYTSYPDAPQYTYVPSGALIASAANAEGKQIVQAPKFSLQATATYTLPTAIGVFTTTANVNYQSKQYGDPLNAFPIRARTLLGLNEQWSSNDEDTTVTLWVKNLTDVKWNTNVALVAPTGPIGLQGPPRTYGITLEHKFTAAEETAPPVAAYVPPPVVAPAQAPKSYLVFFDFDRSDLSSQATEIVDTAAKNVGPAKVTQLTVTGHTDTVGSDAYNLRLSRRRAEAVAARLEKDGVPASEISIVAKGKRDLLVPTADGVREPQNRRVQIVSDGGANS